MKRKLSLAVAAALMGSLMVAAPASASGGKHKPANGNLTVSIYTFGYSHGQLVIAKAVNAQLTKAQVDGAASASAHASLAPAEVSLTKGAGVSAPIVVNVSPHGGGAGFTESLTTAQADAIMAGSGSDVGIWSNGAGTLAVLGRWIVLPS